LIFVVIVVLFQLVLVELLGTENVSILGRSSCCCELFGGRYLVELLCLEHFVFRVGSIELVVVY